MSILCVFKINHTLLLTVATMTDVAIRNNTPISSHINWHREIATLFTKTNHPISNQTVSKFHIVF
jgi:hypothetical protein